MFDVTVCPECLVPEGFQQEISWLNNGDIVQKLNARGRAAFIECENLDPLFKNIGDIIGMPIERLVVNITARGSELFNSAAMPDALKEMIRSKQIDIVPIAEAIGMRGQIFGYGKHEWVDYRYENDHDDFSIQRVTQPFSVALIAGSYAGALSAAVGGEHGVSYEEEEPGVYVFKTHWTEYHEELKKRMEIIPYEHQDGDCDTERCANCGGPKGLSVYQWFPEEGLIKHSLSGRRMALLGPQLMDPIFTALEDELGETIPRTVVEAQRRFVRTGFDFADFMGGAENLRAGLAIRGLGNLQQFKMTGSGVRMELDNACLPLLLLGFIQGTFELAFDIESDIDWEISEGGHLELELIGK